METITKKHGVVKLFKELDNGKESHLYFTSNDEIKEGDPIYSPISKRVFTSVDGSYLKQVENPIDKKIIATTDPKLGLPQIPQSFIEYYVKNPVDEVELEYEMNGEYDGSCTASLKNTTKLKFSDEVVVVESKVPLLSEIMTGQKLYTKEEIEKLCKQAWIKGGQDCASGRFDGPEQWIKKNL